VSHSTDPVEDLNQRYSHLGMPDKISSRSSATSNRRRRTLHKVTEFPKPSGSEARDAGPTIIFEFEQRRFASDWNVAELNHKPAEVVPILKQRQRKERSPSRKP
jgi:hypothetical protein